MSRDSKPAMMPSRRQMLASGAALMLPACALLNRPNPPQIYVLRPQPAPAAMGDSVRWRLAVGTPNANSSLDTPRIALTRSATTMDYFANAAWADRVPVLVQRMLVQAFENSGRIASVDRDAAGLEIDYLLQIEIQDFQARYASPTGAPMVDIAMQVKLVRMPEREIVGGVFASEQAMAAGNTLDNIVNAFNQATGAAVSRIVAWTLAQPAPRPPALTP